MIAYHFNGFLFETVLGREHPRKVTKKCIGNFYFWWFTLIMDLVPVFNDDNTPQIAGLVRFLTFVYMPLRFRNFGLSKCLLHTCFWGALYALFVGGHFIRIEPLDSFSLFLLLLHVSACTLSVDNSVFCQILLCFFSVFFKVHFASMGILFNIIYCLCTWEWHRQSSSTVSATKLALVWDSRQFYAVMNLRGR